MKKFLVLSLVVLVSFVVSSCGAFGIMSASMYCGAKVPAGITSNELGDKVGTGEIINVLGMVCIGDASSNSAAKSAGIKRISHMDYEYFSVLGLFTKQTVFVYGK